MQTLDQLEQLELKFAGAKSLFFQDVGHDVRYWRSMRSSDILQLFGVGGAGGNGAIPKDFDNGRWIGDTYVVILPIDRRVHKLGAATWNLGLGQRIPKRRVLAQCNRCERLVCAGHLHQHRNGRKCVSNTKGG